MTTVIAEAGPVRKVSGPMFSPMLKAIAQLDDPALLGVIGKCLTLSGLCFALLCAGAAAGLHHALLMHGWLAWAAGILGGLAAALAALWLFLPLAAVIAAMFAQEVACAVERRWYPGLPPARPAPWASQMRDGLSLGLLVMAMSAFSLVLTLVLPGIGLVLGWGITAWALGRGLFMGVAMRRMARTQALACYRRHGLAIFGQAVLLTAAAAVPLLNLLVPLLGTACMVHVLMAASARDIT